jgi:YggT family protein
MSRDMDTPRGRTRDGIRVGDGRRDVRYEPADAEHRPPQGDMEPNRVEVERRGGTERRVADEPVEVDRRLEQRRTEEEERRAAEEERRAAREREQREARERRQYYVGRATQAVDYLFILLYGMLGIRFTLALLGASQQAGFVQFINGITDPFYAPFANIVARPSVNGGFLDFPLLIALLAYALLHLAIRGLMRLVAGARTVP